MKKILTLVFTISTLFVAAQTQLGINYQSIIRNVGGTVMASTPVTVEFKLYSTVTFTNVLLYHETHSTTTNQFGMVNLAIGQGTVVGGAVTFSNVPWIGGVAYEVYVNSSLVGSRQPFLSVPYALAAAYAPAPSVTFSNNILSVGGNTASITSGTTYTAGQGINIAGSTITGTANITGAGATTVTGVYPNLTINTPTTQAYTAGNGIDITGGIISNTAIAVTPTITAGTNVTINPAGPSNTYTINAPTYALSQSGNAIDLLQNGTSVGTATLPTVTSYSAGNGIDITGGVISNTAVAVTPTITGTGVAAISPTVGNTFNVDVPAPILNYNSSTKELSITQGTAVSTQTLNGTGTNTVSIVGSGLATVTPTTGSTFTVSVPSPTFTANGPTTITGTFPNLTINSAASPSTTLVPGNNITLNQSGNTYTVDAVTPSLSVVGGILSGAYPTQTLTIPNTTLTTITQSTGILVSGSAPNYTISNTQTLSIASNSVISLNPGGGSVNITPAVLSYSAGTNVLKLTDGLSSNTFTLNSTPSTTVAAGANITVLSGASTYTVSAPAYSLTANSNTLTLSNGTAVTTATMQTGILGTGTPSVLPMWGTATSLTNSPISTFTATGGVVVNPATVGTGNPIQSLQVHGPTSGSSFVAHFLNAHTTNTGIGISTQPSGGHALGTLDNQDLGFFTNSTNVTGSYPLMLKTTTGNVGINGDPGTTGKLVITSAATTAAPTMHLKESTVNSLTRMKFSNTNVTNSFFEIAAQVTSTFGTSALSFNVNDASNTYNPVLLISGGRQVYVNGLNLPLSSFHVMESATTAGGGMISEGFAQPGQITVARNNQTTTTRLAVSAGNELGRLVFAGYNGTAYSGTSSKISVLATENYTGSNQGAEMILSTVPNGTTTSQGVLKLTNDGNVVVNPANTIAKAMLDVKGKVNIDSTLNFRGYNNVPSVSIGSEGKLFYNKSTQKFMVSENGGAYVNLIGGTAPWIQGVGTVTLTNLTDKVGIGTNTPNSSLHVVNTSTTSIGLIVGLADANNSNKAVEVTQGGLGIAGDFNINNTSNVSTALSAKTTGGGDAILGSQSGSGGRAGAFVTGNASNASHTLFSQTSGIGAAGFFEVINTSSNGNAISAHHYGVGATVVGVAHGAGGAGAFTISNATNTAVSLNVTTNGSGNAISASNSSTVNATVYAANGSAGDVFFSAGGTGRAYYGVNNSSTLSTMELASNGGGNVIYAYKNNGAPSGNVASFSNNSTSNISDAVLITDNGTGNGIRVSKPLGTNGSVAKFENLSTGGSADAVFVSNVGSGASLHTSNSTVSTGSNLGLLIEDGHIGSANGTNLTASSGTSCGCLGSITMDGHSTDVAGTLRAVISASTSVNIDFDVTFAKPYKKYPVIVVTPNSVPLPGSNYPKILVTPNGVTGNFTGFKITIVGGSINTGSVAPYLFNYMVIEGKN